MDLTFKQCLKNVSLQNIIDPHLLFILFVCLFIYIFININILNVNINNNNSNNNSFI